METATQPSTLVQQLAQVIAEMPEEMAREVLHYAEYLKARSDSAIDIAMAATTPDQWSKIADGVRAQVKAGKTRPLFDDSGEVALP